MVKSAFRVLGALAMLAGCDSKPLTSDQTVPYVRSIDDFPSALAVGICQAYERCCLAQGFDFEPPHCRAALTEYFEEELAGLAALRVDFDPQAANDCVAENMNLICPSEPTDLSVMPAACASTLRGQLAPGEPCVDHVECRDQQSRASLCDLELGCMLEPDYQRVGRGEPCQATCRLGQSSAADCTPLQLPTQPDPGAMAACFESDGLFCSAVSETCEPTAQIGDSCAVDFICPVGAYCALANDLCLATRSSGPCADDPNACDADSYCNFAQDACLPRRLAHGRACKRDADCESYYCNRDHVCQPPVEPDVCASAFD